MCRSLFGLLLVLGAPLVSHGASQGSPNVIFILADDLGVGDLGCFGQEKIRTPNLDRLAKNGLRFTQAYAGSTVCAPSRCCLMTGLHTGHCRTRGNGGGGGPRRNVPLGPADLCVAEVFKKAGYTTALIGKWGLGEEGSPGVPNRKGFDHFFGYLNQHHAHNYYPTFLWRNGEKIGLKNQPSQVENVAKSSVDYAPDLLREEAVRFITENQSKPFFLYFATIAPHANNEKTRATGEGNEVPSDSPYTQQPWPQAEKNKAAMITRLDADIGILLARLKELGLEEKTLVLFASDNGPHKEGGNDPAFFRSSGPFRGWKRSLTEGGIRTPAIASWPGVIKAGGTSDHVWAFWDFLPTVCDLVGEQTPQGLDGLSILPTLTGKGVQKTHDFLYWEFHEGGSIQAVRHGNWKAVRPLGRPLELFDVTRDPMEIVNLASAQPEVVQKIEAYLTTARTESREFPMQIPRKK